MAAEDESEVRASLRECIEAIRELIPALHAMAESNCRIAEALITAGATDGEEDDPDLQYLDGTPLV
jgi:signal transduction histidine kinase